MPSTIHYLIGIPGSGKSTYAGKIQKKEGAEILASDEIRKELTGDENDISTIPHGEIFKILRSRAQKLIDEGKNFVYDATNIGVDFRRQDIMNWKKNGAKIIGVLLITPEEVAIARNNNRSRVVPEEVIKNMYRNLSNNPLETSKDLFDEIVMIDEDGREELIFNREGENNKHSIISAEAGFIKR